MWLGMIIFAIVLIVGLWGMIGFLRADPHILALKIRLWGQRLVIVLLAISIMVLLVRFGWYGVAPLLAAPLLIKIKIIIRIVRAVLRFRRLRHNFWKTAHMWQENSQSFKQSFDSNEPPAADQASCQYTITHTDWLEVMIDSAGNIVNGRVSAGPLAGCKLETLSDKQLSDLTIFLHEKDRQSAELLYTYVRNKTSSAHQDTNGQNKRYAQTQNSESDEPVMNESLALAILGLPPNPDKTAILHAYRERIRSTHPDYGGSTRMAARVNAARDYLIERV